VDPNVNQSDISAWVILDANPNAKSVNPRFKAGTGVIKCRINWQRYGMVGEHWKNQLIGTNRQKWGKIYIDADEREQAINRRDALWPHKESTANRTRKQKREAAATNLDECPGAMFVWESREPADVEPVCAQLNQDFGRDLYFALAGAVQRAMVKPTRFRRRDMQWFRVEFEFW
jgi:hypothetical protein